MKKVFKGTIEPSCLLCKKNVFEKYEKFLKCHSCLNLVARFEFVGAYPQQNSTTEIFLATIF